MIWDIILTAYEVRELVVATEELIYCKLSLYFSDLKFQINKNDPEIKNGFALLARYIFAN